MTYKLHTSLIPDSLALYSSVIIVHAQLSFGTKTLQPLNSGVAEPTIMKGTKVLTLELGAVGMFVTVSRAI